MLNKNRSTSTSKSPQKVEKVLVLRDNKTNVKRSVELLDIHPPAHNRNKSVQYRSGLKLPQIALEDSAKSISRTTLQIPDSEDFYSNALQRLELIWAQKHIPTEMQEIFKNCILPLPRQKGTIIINSEVAALKSNVSPVQTTLKAIKNREDSLESIHELNSYLESTEWLPIKEVHLQCAELLHGHRLFTLSVVESILKWKEALSSSLIINNSRHKQIEFKWEKKNYLLKMRTDLDFLKKSQFSKIFDFEENDPLLIKPSVPSGKNERGRKRDSNYFVDAGQVIIPIPSFLMARVKQAEDEIRNEYEYIKFLEENTPAKQALMFGPLLLETIIEEIVNESVGEMGKELDKQQKEAKKQARAERANEKLAEKLLQAEIEALIMKDITEIAEKELQESLKNKANQAKDALAIKLTEDLLSEFLSTVNIKDLCQSEYSNLKSEAEYHKKMAKEQNEYISSTISKEIESSLLELICLSEITVIAKEALREMRKEQDEENKIYIIRSPLMEEIGLDFASADSFSNISDMRWAPMKLPEELINDVMNEYLSLCPDISNSIMPDIEELMREVTKYMDTCWYWAIKGTLILGILVYSVDCFNKSGRKLIVHYVSSLLWKSFPMILESATAHLLKIDPCDEIRVNLFSNKGIDLTPEVKRMFTSQNYKWKTKIPLSNSEHEITVLGKSRKDKASMPNGQKVSVNPTYIAFKLKNSVITTTATSSKNNTNLVSEMGIVGNRANLLHSIISLFGDIENSLLKLTTVAKNKLQGFLTNLFKSIIETHSFTFPYMSGVNSGPKFPMFLAGHGLTLPPNSEKNAAVSVFSLGFRWISCNNYAQEIRGQNYRFLRFRSEDIRCEVLGTDYEIFYVPTELPNITAFFIKAEGMYTDILKSVNTSQVDLFSITESLVSGEGTEEAAELWVPCFNKAVKWEIPWIEGYEIPAQNGGSSLFVDKCCEEVKFGMNLLSIPEGLLICNNKYGPVLSNDFVFGLVHSKGDKIPNIPLFSCLIRESDWIKA